MSDISKCNGEGCKLKESCWRYLAPSSQLQSFILLTDEQKKDCEYYWHEQEYQGDKDEEV